MATAELAVALPVLAVLLVLGAGVLQTIGAGLRCQDAARLAARAAARGEAPAAVEATARAAAPAGAAVEVRRDGDTVHVTVSWAASIPGPWRDDGPRWTVRGEATAAAEPAAVAGSP
ncbi:MAG TPA: TadE family type IV pilus minor pilin [Mycobacteriales bacterium]|jgi:hypothetical protein|nr:TadE family type IV pilus minor pilin [Mycobacteriales bacterium]